MAMLPVLLSKKFTPSVVRPEPFSIRVLPRQVRRSDGRRIGQICIGSHTERFTVSPLAGSVEIVASRWVDELWRLVHRAPAIGLPIASNMAWVLYRFGSGVVVQQMLMLPGVGPKLLPSGRVTRIPDYSSANPDGQPISEWETTVGAIRAFLVS